MPRIRLQPQPAYAHQTTLTVRVTDVNYGGHLANNALPGLLHQARIEWLQELGCAETDLGDGTGLIMTDMAVSFAAEGRMLDRLTVRSAFTEVRKRTFRMCHQVQRDHETVALAELGFAGYSYARSRLAALPGPFTDRIRGLAPDSDDD